MSAHNLPRPSTPFVGRAEEVAQIAHLLNGGDCRLLTLTGTGGIGKTRLAVEVTQMIARMSEKQVAPTTFAHGVHFVNFQPVASIDVFASTVADALNITGREHPQTRLLNFLREKEMLLVFDNLEHLLNGIEWISDVLANASKLKILTTSREALKLQEEWLYPIRGLSFPTDTDESEVERYEAVQVFLQSARRVQPDFLIAREQRGLIRICRQTEGIPLAVEMAASWVNVLSCEQIADEMQNSMNFLTASARNLPERHRSMRAVFDHSWGLLSENERQVFRKLSIFHGGFTLDAAEQVTGAKLLVLAALVEKSLVRRLPSGRWDMHQLLRQFAEEKLRESIEEKNAVRDRHCAYYAEYLHQLTKHMRSDGEHSALQAIEKELDNVRACWERAIEQINIEAFKKCQESLRVFYHVQDRFHEGESIFGRAVAALERVEPGEARDVTLALLLIGHGKCCLRLGQHQRAKEMLESSVAILRHYKVYRELGWALYDLSRVLHEREEFREAARVEQESLALGKAAGDIALIAWSYFELSCTVRMYGNYSDSLHFMQESVSHLIKSGDEDGIAIGLRGLGERLRERGEYYRAKPIYQQAIAIHRKLNYKTKLSTVLEGYGATLFALGQYEAAREIIEESLAIARELGFPRRLAFSLISLANVSLSLGDLDAAERYFHESLMVSTKTAEPWQQALSTKGLGRIAFRRGQYDDAKAFFQESLVVNRNMEFRLETATSLSELGSVAVVQGNMLEARRFFRDSLSIGLEIQLTPVLLEIMMGIAGLFVAEGEHAKAIKLVATIVDHPASHHVVKDRAREASEILNPLKAEYSPPARKREEAVDVLAAELLGELTATLGETVLQVQQMLVEPLSQRELEVLTLVAEGFTNRDIAIQLYIGISTVKKHMNHLYRKLDVKNRTQAVARAREYKILR